MMLSFPEMSPDTLEEIFMFYFFAEVILNTQTTSLPVDGHAIHVNLI